MKRFLAVMWWLSAWTALLLTVTVLLGMTLVGQRWHGFALLMHLPLYVWPIAMLLLALVGVKQSARLRVALLVLALVQLGPLLGWRSHGQLVTRFSSTPERDLRVVTCNRGQNNGHSITDFLRQTRPELLIIQDAHAPQSYLPHSPDYAALPHQTRIGELAVLSHHPLVSTQLISVKPSAPLRSRGPWHKLLRVVLDWRGQQVVVYTLHLPSPRHPLMLYRSGAVLESEASLQRAKHYWEDHRLLAHAVVEEVEQDMQRTGLPTLVAGDWNMPCFGPLYQRVTRQLQDSHVQAGHGWGFTCPADLRALSSLHHPWLRLDLILASQHWQILAHEKEDQRQAQHCAVAAVLRLRSR